MSKKHYDFSFLDEEEEKKEEEQTKKDDGYDFSFLDEEKKPAPEIKQKEIEDTGSYMGDIFERLGSALLKVPEKAVKAEKFISDLSNLPAKLMIKKSLEKEGVYTEDDIEDISSVLSQTINSTAPFQLSDEDYKEIMDSDFMKSMSEKSERLREQTMGHDKRIQDYFKEGEITKGVGAMILSGVESAPDMALAMFGGVAGLGAVGLMAAGEKYDQLEKDSNVDDVAKIINSGVTGGLEILTERLGSANYGKMLKQLYSKGGKEAVQKSVQATTKAWYANMLKKAGVYTAPIGEGLEELSNQMAENVVDWVSGVDTELDLKENVLESFLQGVGGGTITTGAAMVGDIKNALTQPKQAEKEVYKESPEKDIQLKTQEDILEEKTDNDQPIYKIGDKTFNDKTEFLDEVGKLKGQENTPEIKIENDEGALLEVTNILKPEKDAEEYKGTQVQEQTTEEGVQSGESDSNMPEIDQTELQDGEETEVDREGEGKTLAANINKFTEELTSDVGMEDRKNKLTDFINQNKQSLQKVTGRQVPAALRKVNNIKTEKSFKNAVEYLNKIANDAEFRKSQIERASTLSKLEKISNPSKIVKKSGEVQGIKGGYAKEGAEPFVQNLNKVYSFLKSDINEQIRQKEEFGKQSEEIVKKSNDENRDFTEDELDFLESGKVYTIDDMSNQELYDFYREIKDLKTNQRLKGKQEREARKQQRLEINKKIQEDIKPPEPVKRRFETKKRFEARKNKMRPRDIEEINAGDVIQKNKWFAVNFDNSLFSTLNKIAINKKDKSKAGDSFLEKTFIKDPKTGLPQAEVNYRKGKREESEYVKEGFKKIYGAKKGKDYRTALARLQEDLNPIPYVNRNGEKKEITLTRDQAIKKYQELQNEDLSDTFFSEIEVDEATGTQSGMGWNEESVNAIESQLTEEDKKLADFLSNDFFKKSNDKYNDEVKRQTGLPLPKGDWYSPRYRIGYYKEDGDVFSNSGFGSTVRSDNIITRKASKAPLKNVGAMEAVNDYIDNMERYVNFAEPMKLWKEVFRDKKTRNDISQFIGKDILKDIDYYEKVMSNNPSIMKEKWLTNTLRRFSRAALGINPRVTLKQLISINMAMTEMPLHKFAKYFPQAFTPKGIKTISDLSKRESIQQRGEDVAAGLDAIFGGDKKNRPLSPNSFVREAQYLLEQGKKLSTWNIRFGDRTAALLGGYTVYRNALDKYRGDKNAEEKALKDFDLWVDGTQQSMSMFNISWRRGENPLYQAMGSFTSGPAQLNRLAGTYAREIQKGRNVASNLRNFLTTHVLTGALYALAGNDWKWDGEKILWGSLFGNITGVLMIGKLAAGVKTRVLKENYPTEFLPILENIVDAKDALMTYYNMEKEGASDEELKKAGTKAAKAVSFVVGVPVEWSRDFDKKEGDGL